MTTTTESSDKSSQKDDNESINSSQQPRQKMSRLTALSRGLLTTELNGSRKAPGKFKRLEFMQELVDYIFFASLMKKVL